MDIVVKDSNGTQLTEGDTVTVGEVLGILEAGGGAASNGASPSATPQASTPPAPPTAKSGSPR